MLRHRKNYPAKGAHRLEERSGRLYYAEHDIGPVPVFQRGRTFARVSVDGTSQRLRAAIGRGWHLYAIYCCRHCGHWAAGSGFTWCSDECRRLGQAQQARNYRAELTKARAAGIVCAECGAPMQVRRRTRKFCSDRCRQAARRKAVAA